MLRFVVLINGPSYLSIISVEEVFHLIGVIISIICFRTGRISPQLWEVFHKPTTNLCFSLLIFQQLRSILLCKDAFQTQLWQKLAFSSPFCYSNDPSSIFSSEGIVMLLFSLIISNCEDRVLFVLILLTGVSCLFSSIFSSCQYHVQFLPFTVGVLPKLYQSYSSSI